MYFGERCDPARGGTVQYVLAYIAVCTVCHSPEFLCLLSFCMSVDLFVCVYGSDASVCVGV